jgi:hypothetical protein
MKIDNAQEESPETNQTHDLAEAAAVSLTTGILPRMIRQNPFSSRVIFIFPGSPATILGARRAFWDDEPLPARSLLARAKDLKAAVKSPFGSQAPR